MSIMQHFEAAPAWKRDLARLYITERRKGTRAFEAMWHARNAYGQGKRTVAYHDTFLSISGITRQPKRPNYAWIENTGACGLRFVDFADQIAKRIGHKGWYCDEFQDETYRGAVYRLPNQRGFIAGYADPHNKGAAFVELRTVGDETEAAHAANRIAEREAEREREYQEVANARIRFDDLESDIRNARQSCLALIREYKHGRVLLANYAEIRKTVCASVRDYRAEIESCRARREKLESAYSHHKAWGDA